MFLKGLKCSSSFPPHLAQHEGALDLPEALHGGLYLLQMDRGHVDGREPVGGDEPDRQLRPGQGQQLLMIAREGSVLAKKAVEHTRLCSNLVPCDQLQLLLQPLHRLHGQVGAEVGVSGNQAVAKHDHAGVAGAADLAGRALDVDQRHLRTARKGTV